MRMLKYMAAWQTLPPLSLLDARTQFLQTLWSVYTDDDASPPVIANAPKFT